MVSVYLINGVDDTPMMFLHAIANGWDGVCVAHVVWREVTGIVRTSDGRRSRLRVLTQVSRSGRGCDCGHFQLAAGEDAAEWNMSGRSRGNKPITEMKSMLRVIADSDRPDHGEKADFSKPDNFTLVPSWTRGGTIARSSLQRVQRQQR